MGASMARRVVVVTSKRGASVNDEAWSILKYTNLNLSILLSLTSAPVAVRGGRGTA